MALGDLTEVGERPPAGAEQEPTSEARGGSSGSRTSVRAAALTLAVALDAIAFATMLRPRHGYRSADRLLLTLAIGVGAALGALAIVAALTALRRRHHRSVWEVMTALPTLGLVLLAFIAASAGSQLAPAPGGPPTQAGSSEAARADFERWQATVVPIVVGWMDAVRVDRAFTHNVPIAALEGLKASVDQSLQTLDRLARSLAAASPQLPQRPQLRQLTLELQAALAAAQRAEQTYALALDAAARRGEARSGRAYPVRTLIDRGNAETRESLSTMTAFSFAANAVGQSMLADRP